MPVMVIGVFLGGRIHANLSGFSFQRLIAILLILNKFPLPAQ